MRIQISLLTACKSEMREAPRALTDKRRLSSSRDFGFLVPLERTGNGDGFPIGILSSLYFLCYKKEVSMSGLSITLGGLHHRNAMNGLDEVRSF